jgi:tartrate-resistant acid phosphatase type 5
MPSRYFTFVYNEDGINARFIFIDTSPFEKEYYLDEGYKNEISKQDTTRQKIWLDSVLSLNDTKWKFVSGHHPLYTGGKRAKEFNTVRQSLEPLFIKHNVDVYLAGHEHDLQYIKAADKPTHHFVSGTGSEVRPTGKLSDTKFADSIEGIMAFSLSPNQLKVQVLSYKGDVIYSTVIDKK